MKTERVEGASSGHHRRGITVVRSTMREGWLSEVSTAATVEDRLVFKSLHLTNAMPLRMPPMPRSSPRLLPIHPTPPPLSEPGPSSNPYLDAQHLGQR